MSDTQKTLVSLEERKNMPTKVYGENIKIKVVDFEKAVKAHVDARRKKGMSMIIDLKVLKVDKYKELSYTIPFVKDALTGIYYGIPFGLHPDGNVKWRKITLRDFNTFNLNIDNEAMQWLVVRMHGSVQGSPFELADPLFWVYDPDVEAENTRIKAMESRTAIDKASKMKKSDILAFHRYLSLPMPVDVTPGIVRADLLSYAMTNPHDFMVKFNDPNRQLNELFITARSFGIIQYEIEKGFTYSGQFLGNTDIEAITMLHEDSVLITAIKAKLKDKDTDQSKFVDSKDDNDDNDKQ